MNKIKLPSMVEYVKLKSYFGMEIQSLRHQIQNRANRFADCKNFANFLSQQPNIGMFVPAVEENGEWRILEAPNRSTHTNEECDQYATALDNVIFEGFELNQKDTSKLENIICITLGKIQLTFFLKNKALFLDNLENNYTTEIKTIEDLIPYSLTLTPKFAKELGLI